MKPISFKTHIDILKYLKTSYIEIPETIVKKIGGIGKQRLICEVNKQIKFQCGLMALSDGKAYISINTKRMKEISVVIGDTVNVTITADESEYGVELAEELAELFLQDPEGKKRFDQLTPGKKRYILNYVSIVKSPQLRLERAFLLITNLKTIPNGKEQMRDLIKPL
jgi:ABC-type molybdenum transport system ATPase subunit/photorepair protein PhrA